MYPSSFGKVGYLCPVLVGICACTESTTCMVCCRVCFRRLRACGVLWICVTRSPLHCRSIIHLGDLGKRRRREKHQTTCKSSTENVRRNGAAEGLPTPDINGHMSRVPSGHPRTYNLGSRGLERRDRTPKRVHLAVYLLFQAASAGRMGFCIEHLVICDAGTC